MKLALVSTIMHFPLGGADTLWVKAAEAAALRGHQLLLSVSPAVGAHPRIQALRNQGALLDERSPTTVPRSLPARVARRIGWTKTEDAHLAAVLQKFGPDLVIISQGGTYDLALYPQVVGWLIARNVRFRLIANWQSEHPQLEESSFPLVRDLFPRADAIYFVSHRNLEVTREHLGLPLANARVIQNPLRSQQSDVAPWPQAAEVRLATVSRLESSKGIQMLLHALGRQEAALPAWRLNIYGQGNYERELRAVAERLQLARHVTFRGYEARLREIWAENQLMISPAIDDGVPMTIPEAMLCERPVLATRVGGAEEWIRDGETGYLCSAADPDALGAALARAFAARDRWPAMGRAAAQSAAARYRPEDYLQLIAV